MEKTALRKITAVLRDLDINHEFTEFLSDDDKIEQIQAEEFKRVQKTLITLSEFGHLKGATDKLKNIMEQAKEGKITYEDLRRSIQKTAKISLEEMLDMYKISENYFSEAKFEDAAAVSAFLSYLNPEISAFWRMTGSCYWNLGNEKAALSPFLYAAMVNSLEIDNHLAALDCLIKLGFSQEALNYYKIAKDVLSDAKKWDDIKKLDSKIAQA